MNKVAAAVLAAAMVGSMAVPAFAADTVYGSTDINGNYTQSDGTSDNGTRSRQTEVKYTVTSAYNWTIHSEVDLTEGNHTKANQEVSVTNCVIPENTKLQITVKGQGQGGAFEIKSQKTGTDGQTEDGNVQRAYTVQSDSGNGSAKSNITANGTVMEVDAGIESKTAKVDFALVGIDEQGKSEVAGSYKGTVTYTASIVENGGNSISGT